LPRSCRLGLKGRLEIWGANTRGIVRPRGIIRDIEKGAKLTIIESETEGPRLARYRPHPNALARSQERDALADAIAAVPF
jgi:hypothetical protein